MTAKSPLHIKIEPKNFANKYMSLIKTFLRKILNKSLHLDRRQKGLLSTNKIYIKSVQYLNMKVVV